MQESQTIDTKLKMLRISRNLTQDEVAEKIGISQAAYAKLEAGQTRLTIDRAGQLAELYEIEPEYFFTNEKITNFNTGNNSHGGLFHNSTYNNVEKDFFEKLLEENNSLRKLFLEELGEARKERDQFVKLLEKLMQKF